MTADFERDDSGERSAPERGERSAGRPNEVERPTGPPRRVLADGGQAEMEVPDDEGDVSGAPQDESAQKDDEEVASSEESAEDADGAGGAESEADAEDEQPADEAAEEPAEEGADEGDGESDEDEDDRADTGDLVEDDRAEGHAADAEDVYEGDDAAGVLHLDLDGLFLDVLGLEVNLNPVQLDVSARPGSNNLLGNLLSAVTGLLDGSGAVLDNVKSLLGKPIELLTQVPGKATELLSGLLGKTKEALVGLLERPKEWLTDLLGIGAKGDDGAESEESEGEESESGGPLSSLGGWLKGILAKPVEWLRGLFGGERAESEAVPDEGEETGEAADETDGEEAEDETDEEGAGEESPGPLARVSGWLREKLAGLVPSLPVEEIIAAVVSQVIEQLIERLEPARSASVTEGRGQASARSSLTAIRADGHGMTRHVSETQVRHWLDDTAIRSVTPHTDEETAFNCQVELSQLPVHVIKEAEFGPVRIVGRSGFDTERARDLLRDDRRRAELLEYVGPMLAATPGFYTFLDEAGAACRLREAETVQVEYRVYPNGASQQALMDGIMAIATSMRYVRNAVAAVAEAA